MSAMIDRLNHPHDPAADMASLRLCVEAVDVMLSNQAELVRVLRQLTDTEMPTPTLRRAA